MNALEQAVKDYISIRRSLGFQLRQPENLLRSFVAFLQAEGASHITTELALRWATQPTKAEPARWAARLGMVRCFAIWYSAIERCTEVPSESLLPYHHRRKPPHIYSDEEIERLLRQAQRLPSPLGLRARTFTTLFGLLVATGLRVNEALALDQPDVDFDQGILYIRRAKFSKSRYVPIHSTTVAALKKYADARDCVFPAPLTPAFFISERGTRITGGAARYTFAKLSQQLGLRVPAKHHGRGPRLQDLRHNSGTRIIPSTDRQSGLLLEDHAIAQATMAA